MCPRQGVPSGNVSVCKDLYRFGQEPVSRQSCIIYIKARFGNRKGAHLPLNFQARFCRVRARVPMYRLFLTIFLWFWLTAWGILAIVFLGSRLTGIRQVSAPNMYTTSAPILADQARKANKSCVPGAFCRLWTSCEEASASQV